MARQRLILNDTTARFLGKNTANATRLANGDWDFGESEYDDRAFAFQGEPSDSPVYNSPPPTITNPTARPPGQPNGTTPGFPGPRDPNAPTTSTPPGTSPPTTNNPFGRGPPNTTPPPPGTTPDSGGRGGPDGGPALASNPFASTATGKRRDVSNQITGRDYSGGGMVGNPTARQSSFGQTPLPGSGNPVNMPATTNGVHTPGANTNLSNAAQVAANQAVAKNASNTNAPPGPTATQPQPGSNLLDPGEAERRWRAPITNAGNRGTGNDPQFDPNRWGSYGMPLWSNSGLGAIDPRTLTDGTAGNNYLFDDPRLFIREVQSGSEAGSGTVTYRLRPDVAARFVRNANGEVDPNGSVWGQPGQRGVYDWSRVTYDPEFGILTPQENIIPSPDTFIDKWAPVIIQAVAIGAIGYGVGTAVGGLINGTTPPPGIDGTGTPLPNGTPPGGLGNPYAPTGPTNPMVPNPGPTTPPNGTNPGPGPNGNSLTNPTPPPNDPSLGGPEVVNGGRITVTAPRAPPTVNSPLVPPIISPGSSPNSPSNNNQPNNNTNNRETPQNTQPTRSNWNRFQSFVRNGMMTVSAYNLLARQFGWPTIGGGNTNGNSPGGSGVGDLINGAIGINQDNRDRRWFDGRVNELLDRGDFYRNHRQAAIDRYNNFLMNPDAALQDEGFKKVRERSLENLSRKYNARGMALSGNEMGALTEYGQELDWKQIQQEREELRAAMNLGDPTGMARAGINAAGQSMRNRQNNSFNRGRFSNDLLNTKIGGKSVLEWAATIAEKGWNAVSDAVRSWFQENGVDPYEIDGDYGDYDPNIPYNPEVDPDGPEVDPTDDTGNWWDGYI